MNFLESLAAEWYAIQGYFMRTNIKANRRGNGGWNNEIDVLAYDPGSAKLVHLETSKGSQRTPTLFGPFRIPRGTTG